MYILGVVCYTYVHANPHSTDLITIATTNQLADITKVSLHIIHTAKFILRKLCGQLSAEFKYHGIKSYMVTKVSLYIIHMKENHYCTTNIHLNLTHTLPSYADHTSLSPSMTTIAKYTHAQVQVPLLLFL